MKRDFNGFAKFCLVVSMLSVIVDTIGAIQKLSMIDLYYNLEEDTLIFAIVLNSLIIIAAIFTFLRKSIALAALTLLFIIKFISFLPDGSILYSYMFGKKLVILFRDFGLFAIAMCFKKNGVSGWKSMLGRIPESNNDNEVLSEEQKQEDITILKDHKIEVSVLRNTKKTNINRNRVYKKVFLRTTLSGLCIASILVIALALFRSHPSCIDSFQDKIKYTLRLPNNKLAKDIYNRAMNIMPEGSFLFAKENNIVYESLYHHDRIDDILDNYMNAKAYMMRDTIKCKSDILPSANYAKKSHDAHGWEIKSGEMCILSYDDCVNDNSNILLIKLEEQNLERRYEQAKNLMKDVYLLPVTNEELIWDICDYYNYNDNYNYNKIIDFCKLSLKYRRSADILWRMADALYQINNLSDARETIDRALAIEPKNNSALELLCKIEADANNWDRVKEFAKKSIDYGNDNDDIYYLYAQSLYEHGDEYNARKYYNLGYNKNDIARSPLAEKYKKSGGCPFVFKYMDFAFHDWKGNNLTSFGSYTLNYSKSQFLKIKIHVDNERTESCSIYFKLYHQDKLINKCIYDSTLWLRSLGEMDLTFNTYFGTNKMGAWEFGEYKIEIWYNDIKVGEDYFEVF